MRTSSFLLQILSMVAICLILNAASAHATGVERVSLRTGGGQIGPQEGGGTSAACISDDGRFVTFASQSVDASDIVNPPTSGSLPPLAYQVYLYDRQEQTLEIVSLQDGTTNVPGNASSGWPPPCNKFDTMPQAIDMSGDGRFIAFISGATNLTSGPSPFPTICSAVFLRDRSLQRTYWIDSNFANFDPTYEANAVSISDDAAKVAWGFYEGDELAASGASCNGGDDSSTAVFPFNTLDHAGLRIRSPIGDRIYRIALPGELNPCSAVISPKLSDDGNWLAFGADVGPFLTAKLFRADVSQLSDVSACQGYSVTNISHVAFGSCGQITEPPAVFQYAISSTGRYLVWQAVGPSFGELFFRDMDASPSVPLCVTCGRENTGPYMRSPTSNFQQSQLRYR